MKRIKLRDTGLAISEIGIGAWQASAEWEGRDGGVIAAIRKSYELGVNLVDTAEAYGGGHSESVVGKAIKEVGRDNLVVATKVFGSHLRYEELLKACASSLRRLGLSEIDIYQVHWPDPWEQIPLKTTMKALEKLYDEGKIRAIGVSNFAVRDLEEARSCLSKTDIVTDQLRYNLLQRDIEDEVVPYCRKNRIEILAWSPLAQGVLTGKYGPGRTPREDARAQNPLFTTGNMREAQKLNGLLSAIAHDRSKTLPQVALNWLMTVGNSIPIPGARGPQQAVENAGSAGWELTSSEKGAIEAASKSVKLDYFSR